MVGPLDGIRVIEVASFLAAPSAAALMADMGAIFHLEFVLSFIVSLWSLF